MQYLGIGFLAMIVLEIMSIVWVAGWLGGAATFGLILLSAAAGAMLLRQRGLSSIFLAAALLRGSGQVSAYQLLWPIRFTLAGLLLMSPGFLSTLGALLLMLPFKGKPLAGLSQPGASMFGQPPFGQNPFHTAYRTKHTDDDDIIEGDFTVETDNEAKPAIEDKSQGRKR